MTDFLAEQNSLMERIMRDYGSLIRGAVAKAACGRPGGDDIIAEVHFAVLLTLRKLGTGWNPPKSFIFTVVRNKVNDFLRQKYREKKRVEEMEKHVASQAAAKSEVVSRVHCLSAGEFRVFRLLGLGMTNQEIAESLHVSLHTVRSHMKKIHAKCGVRDRSKLTLIAHQACYRDQPESRDASSVSAEPERSRGRAARDRAGLRRPALWEPPPAPPPAPVDSPTEYVS